MKLKKNNLLAGVGSILFHAFILIILFFTVMKAVVPEEDGGVMVNFGTLDEGAGTFEPEGTPAAEEAPEVTPEEVAPTPPPTTPPAPPTPPTPPKPRQAEKLITQDREESVAIAQQKKKEAERKRKEEETRRQEALRKQQDEQRRQDDIRRKEAERKAEATRKAEAERRRQAEEQRKKEQAIRDRVAGAFGKNNQSNQGSAKSNNSGNQGSPFGNTNRGANKGVGSGFSLSGRSIGAGGLPHPAYTVQEEGVIVVNIVVDPAGNVIAADIGKGTNIDNGSMRRSAIEAARRAKFNSIESSNNQSGTITYRYSLK